MDIKNLIERAVRLLQEQRYTSNRIYTYRWLWSKGIIPFMEAKGLDDYDEEVGKAFMLTCHDGGYLDFHHRDLVKSADILTNVLLHDSIGGRKSYKMPYLLDGEIGGYAEGFLSSLRKLMKHEKTIRAYRKRLCNFVDYLKDKGCQSVADINEDLLVEYISCREYRKAEYVRAVKLYVRFLYDNGVIAKDFSYALKRLGKDLKRVRIPSFYTPEEIRMLEKSISRSSSVGKRNYAMVMLCSRLGLRVSDVANLAFDNIDWRGNTINIIQYKTGNSLSLPLLPEVGNAIIDYLQYGRKKSPSNKVFLSLRPPYEGMTAASVHAAIAVAFADSGVKIEGRHHGGHALRFSLAQRMLDKSTPIPVISETLGHQETDMTRSYVRIDFTHLRQCVLEVPNVSDEFYMQKGGCFYE